jgi:hypothetical protein
MTKATRVAVLSCIFALLTAPAFAGPGGSDPTPPPPPPPDFVVAGGATIAIVTATVGTILPRLIL